MVLKEEYEYSKKLVKDIEWFGVDLLLKKAKDNIEIYEKKQSKEN